MQDSHLVARCNTFGVAIFLRNLVPGTRYLPAGVTSDERTLLLKLRLARLFRALERGQLASGGAFAFFGFQNPLPFVASTL